jgi:hypothetical protein
VQQLLDELSSSELTDWMAFDSLEPFGDQRADLRSGIVAATVANHAMNRPKKAARPVDFMPFMTGKPNGPVLLRDPVQHGMLIAQSLFGKRIR